MSTEIETREAILVTYGDLRNAVGRVRISAPAVLEALLSRGYWLSPRKPGRWKSGEIVLFYQAGLGFTATAKLVDVKTACKADWPFPDIALPREFSIKLSLDGSRVFPTPIDTKPLIERLAFVSNKTNWGTAFRPTPKLIPLADATSILDRAPSGNA